MLTDLQKRLQAMEQGHLPDLKENVITALRNVYDPEIPVNIYDLGLIYDLDITPQGEVNIQMTLTAPGCPVAQTFPYTVESEVMSVPGVSKANVELVWDPPWTQDRMTEAARLQLGLL
jgi:FeS assembly SUF system protein